MPTVAELKKQAKAKGIKGYSKMKKAELIKVLESPKKSSSNSIESLEKQMKGLKLSPKNKKKSFSIEKQPSIKISPKRKTPKLSSKKVSPIGLSIAKQMSIKISPKIKSDKDIIKQISKLLKQIKSQSKKEHIKDIQSIINKMDKNVDLEKAKKDIVEIFKEEGIYNIITDYVGIETTPFDDYMLFLSSIYFPRVSRSQADEVFSNLILKQDYVPGKEDFLINKGFKVKFNKSFKNNFFNSKLKPNEAIGIYIQPKNITYKIVKRPVGHLTKKEKKFNAIRAFTNALKSTNKIFIVPQTSEGRFTGSFGIYFPYDKFTQEKKFFKEFFDKNKDKVVFSEHNAKREFNADANPKTGMVMIKNPNDFKTNVAANDPKTRKIGVFIHQDLNIFYTKKDLPSHFEHNVVITDPIHWRMKIIYL